MEKFPFARRALTSICVRKHANKMKWDEWKEKSSTRVQWTKEQHEFLPTPLHDENM